MVKDFSVSYSDNYLIEAHPGYSVFHNRQVYLSENPVPLGAAL